MAVSSKVREKALRLYQSGLSKSDVCRLLGISRPTLDRWLKSSEVTKSCLYHETAIKDPLFNTRKDKVIPLLFNFGQELEQKVKLWRELVGDRHLHKDSEYVKTLEHDPNFLEFPLPSRVSLPEHFNGDLLNPMNRLIAVCRKVRDNTEPIKIMELPPQYHPDTFSPWFFLRFTEGRTFDSVVMGIEGGTEDPVLGLYLVFWGLGGKVNQL